jgi:hypothetical protein
MKKLVKFSVARFVAISAYAFCCVTTGAYAVEKPLSDLAVAKVKIDSCCGTSFQDMHGIFQISLPADAVPADAKVFLHYGMQKERYISDAKTVFDNWQGVKTVRMILNANDSYEVEVRELIGRRSDGPYRATAIQFVFKIELPSGEILWEKDEAGVMGYLESNFAYYTHWVTKCTMEKLFCDLETKIVY